MRKLPVLMAVRFWTYVMNETYGKRGAFSCTPGCPVSKANQWVNNTVPEIRR